MNPLGAIYEGFRSLDCFLLKQADYITGAYGNFIGVDDITEGRVVNALRRLRGCKPADDPPPPPPPFEGGQCPVVYLFRWQQRRFSGGSWGWSTTVTTVATGPLSIGQADERPPFTCSTPPATNDNNQGLFDGDGVRRVILQNACTDHPTGWQLISLTRNDGLPDNCGSPPPVFPPPTDIDIDINIDYTEEGDNVNITIPVTFSPFFLNFNGELAFPFNFDFGGFEYSGNISFAPEFKFELNPTFNLPRGTDSPIDELPPQDNPQDVEQAPPGQVVIGVAVQSVIVGEQQLTTIATEGMPSILAPRAGSIKFAYSLGISTFWSDDIDVKTSNSFIPCPFSQGADAVVVSPGPGVSVSWVPIFGDRLATARDVLAPGTPE